MITVLFVDDEPDFLDLATDLLSRHTDFAVDTLVSPEEALEKIRTGFYDVVVSDYDMEGMNGITFLRTLRGEGNTIPFIMMTGIGCEHTAIEALNNDADFYLEKGEEPGVMFDHLARRIREAAHRRLTAQALKQANKKLNLLYSVTRHDILNQLTIALGFVEIMKNRISDPSELRYMEKIERSSKTIFSLIEFTKTYQEVGIRPPAWQYLAGTLRGSVASFDLSGVGFTQDVGTFEVYADPLLETVFSNLIDNAIRHGEHVTAITVSAGLREDGSLSIRVEDDGVGVPASDKERIFERGRGKNFGWGLFLVREILSITAMSLRETGVYGSGGRFEILVPAGYFRSDPH